MLKQGQSDRLLNWIISTSKRIWPTNLSYWYLWSSWTSYFKNTL